MNNLTILRSVKTIIKLLIETDSKSLNSLSTQSQGSGPGTGHSRKSSDTSQEPILNLYRNIFVTRVILGGNRLTGFIPTLFTCFWWVCGSSGGGSTGAAPLQDPEEDLWGLWGRLVNDWENWRPGKTWNSSSLPWHHLATPCAVPTILLKKRSMRNTSERRRPVKR
ncbi:hypothetical protein Avbf_02065 [Armadillidium vulgare]|nr:hypothetical protein Avbf_02065 [Armadillidium vulgare]